MDSNPLLVNALELDNWASTEKSKGAFPELMRRLLAQTPGVSNINIRAHEGTAARGWDGTATSDGASFLPKGELRFEFGTNQQPKSKADEDYNKRAEQIVGQSDETFVFVTPRNWAGATEWAKQRSSENKFASVEAFDAHRLEGWLQSTPAVHYWISEQIGNPVSGAQTLTSWWEQLHRNCEITVPPEFHSAGRHDESERLMQLLSREGTVFTVQAAWCNDALAFCHAVLLQEDHAKLARALVVSEPEAWRYLAMQCSSLIMIPIFENPDIGLALNNSHSVICPIVEVNTGSYDGNSVKLPKIDRHSGYALLVSAGLERSLADKLVALSRKSMSGFYRWISRDLHRRRPEWAKDRGTVAVLAPLVLVGTWDEDHSGDREAISNFVNEEVDDINLLLDELVDKHPLDPPFIRSGGRWSMVDAVDMAALLLPKLSNSHRVCWKKFAEYVLTREDPLEGLSLKDSIIAQYDERESLVSSSLREGVARSLVLAAASAKQAGRMRPIGQCVDEIVKSLLSAALHERSGRVLSRLASYLPFLAEASPSVFLQCFEDDLNGEAPVTSALFRSAESNVLNSSVSVHNLLMAIECLCWSPDDFGRAARLAVLLADFAPDQKVRGECLDTLDKVLSIRHRLSDASLGDKQIIVQWALSEYPEIAWDLVKRMLSPGGVIVEPCEPVYRDWDVKKSYFQVDEVELCIHELVQIMLSFAECLLDRWLWLLSILELISQEDRLRVLELLSETIDRGCWCADDLFEIWSLISSTVRQCQATPWVVGSLSVEELQPFIDVMKKIEPYDDPRRFAWLFDNEGRIVVSGLTMFDAGFSDCLWDMRSDAIRVVVGWGVEKLRFFVQNVKDPVVAGLCIAREAPELEPEILTWLGDESAGLYKSASAFVQYVSVERGIAWVSEVLRSSLLTREGSKRFVAALPAEKAYWELVSEFEPLLAQAYWECMNVTAIEREGREQAVDLFLERGCVSQAIALLWFMLHDGPEPTLERIVEALVCLIGASDQVGGRGLSNMVADLLSWLERMEPPPPELAMLEFQYFDYLPNHEPSNALYEYLGSNFVEFARLVSSVFLADSNENSEEIQRVYKQRCFNVLFHWRRLPGLRADGSVDGVYLAYWVDGARQLLRADEDEHNYDGQIGEVLASSPDGNDGMWPAEAVRDLIESLRKPQLERGLFRGRLNRRGVTFRGAYEGGAQETALAARYRAQAREMDARWPRTAALLRGLAEEYEKEADRQNAEAEQLGDQD